MLLHFTKMHGLGNDFMVLDLVRQDCQLSTEEIRAFADRRTGVGFDQLLIVEPPTHPSCDFRYRIYNADGTEVEQCGNGARCVARFVRDRGLGLSPRLKFQMGRDFIETEALDNGLVRVNMGVPILDPAEIPFCAGNRETTYALHIPDTGQTLEIGAVSMGNPHAVLRVDDVDSAPVAELGPLIESHRDFPRKVNAGFMQVLDRRAIRLRVFERGVGETRACGTGACAAVVAGRLQGLLDETVTVRLIGGTLSIDWRGENAPVWMTGPATAVYDGQLEI